MERRPLRIAVPKGSLYAASLVLLAQAGLDTTGLEDPGRQLRIGNGDVEYLIVRPTDAPVFCAHGGTDCAISGKDCIAESALDLVELADLRFGGCRFIVAEPESSAGAAQEAYAALGVLRVATKYPRIAKAYYDSLGVQIEIVKLHGNIELAPLIGMADVIVDITATGTTLRENHLTVVADVMESTARFVANPASIRTDKRVRELAAALSAICEDKILAAPIAGASQPMKENRA